MTKKEAIKRRKQLGDRLKQERLNKKLGVREAARKMKINHQNLMNLENGSNFNFCTALKVCSYYELDIEIIQKAV